MPEQPQTVAIFNASDDTVEMLEFVLNEAGFVTTKGHIADIKRGTMDFVAFMEEHKPAAIIWDISLPYDQNWTFFQLLRSSHSLDGCGVVITTTHKPNLDALAGTDTGAIEIVGKPYDLNLVVEAVKRQLAKRQ